MVEPGSGNQDAIKTATESEVGSLKLFWVEIERIQDLFKEQEGKQGDLKEIKNTKDLGVPEMEEFQRYTKVVSDFYSKLSFIDSVRKLREESESFDRIAENITSIIREMQKKDYKNKSQEHFYDWLRGLYGPMVMFLDTLKHQRVSDEIIKEVKDDLERLGSFDL